MSVALTLAGEALIARLQAEGAALTIDRFIFANVPEQDHTAPVNPEQTVPTDHVVYQYDIPQEYRAFVSPNQVVYSALLGSDVGPFTFNWQGLYCSQHNTLVAVATFPALEKRNTNPATNTQGNNLTRNFMLEFTGVRELTQITVEAAVWQLDFTVRLKGIDTRERLSNRDIYGRACFFADGWLLKKSAGTYSLQAGVAYVEGIRTELAEHTPVQPESTPCDVYLDVCMAPQGSDVVTKAEPQFVAVDAPCPDYVEPAPHHTPHYCVHIARIESDGSVTDKRPKNDNVHFITQEKLHEQLNALNKELSGKLDALTTVPVGVILPYEFIPSPEQQAEDGVLICDGAAVSRSTYAALFARIGTVYGAGDGTTTFNLPDKRGEFLRGLDLGRGVDEGRSLGTAQEDSIKSHNHTGHISHPWGGTNNDTASNRIALGGTTSSGYPSITIDAFGGPETRPRNMPTVFCIKY